MSTIVDISELLPVAQKACNLFLQKCAEQGLKVRITETYRSQTRQNQLYAQGRTTEGNIVTWIKKSKHTSRLAWDICQDIKGKEYDTSTGFFQKCGRVAESLGINWGGKWTTPDMPHFEVTSSWTYESEEEPMTTEEKQAFEELVQKVSGLQAVVNSLSQPMIYNYIDDNMPEWAREAVQAAVDNGIISGTGSGLGLTYSDLRTIVREYRAGLYDLRG